jgi:hypothetical protein
MFVIDKHQMMFPAVIAIEFRWKEPCVLKILEGALQIRQESLLTK